MSGHGHMPTAVELAGRGLDRAGVALTEMRQIGEHVLPQFFGLGESAVAEVRRVADAAERAVVVAERFVSLCERVVGEEDDDG